MRKIKYLLLPSAVIVGVAILLNVTGILPLRWHPAIYVIGAAAGLIPLALEIALSLREGKINLGIPVFATIIILLFVRQFLIADIFALLIVMGSIFKEYILWRVERSVSEIAHSLPDTAFLKDGDVHEIHIKDIKKGDVLIVKAGGRVPADGELMSDEASLDESVITGESRLIEKNKGANLVAGSINQGSTFEMKVLSAGDSSTLAQIHRMVKEAQRLSSPLNRFTDRFALINGAVALLGTVIIYLVTKNIMQALAFWIALVPVVFAIIVPVATTIGISMLAKNGVMVKSGETLENLTRIDSIVFDKTGTLTKGSPEISKVVTLDGLYDERTLLELTASVEKYSEHPLSKAFARRAGALHLPISPVQDVHIIKGKGLQAVCKGKKVLIGSAQLSQDMGFTIPPAMETMIKDNEWAGNAPIFVAIDDKPAGIVFLADELRDGIAATLGTLTNMGIRLTMITGDNRIVAEKIAHELGLTRFFAESLPQDKIKYIRNFKAGGEKVIMIGDGINDAPAISAADVGVAMGLKGTDITLNSAKVVLINDNIGDIPFTLTLSKKVLRIIRLDLYIATSIHLAAAVLSLCGIITVLGSALIHQISSIAVLLNTLRLYSLKK